VHDTTRNAGTHPILLIAEDHRNLVSMIQPQEQGGWGLDAVWADDFHHQVRRGLAGDHEGYYSDFSGSMTDLAATIRHGWFFTGQHSGHLGERRGTDPTGTPPSRFVICLQNHDQVGNRAFGERLHHQIDLAAYRAASVLLLCAPQTPLLFMGQEWAASTPFLFFTDHKPDLGKLVTKGRRHEFGGFSAFSDPAVRERIPDPQAIETFDASRLRWSERNDETHAGTLRLHRALLELRRNFTRRLGLPVSGNQIATDQVFSVQPAGNNGILMKRSGSRESLIVVAHLTPADSPAGEVEVGSELLRVGSWKQLLCTEDANFCTDPSAPVIEARDSTHVFRFARPGAVILRTVGSR
jgi:maltooligosyltrehalose trehalohydrolase